MDASLYDNLDQLILVLRGVFAGDNQTIKRTQEALDFMLQDPNKLMDSMAKILTTENSDSKLISASFPYKPFIRNIQPNKEGSLCCYSKNALSFIR